MLVPADAFVSSLQWPQLVFFAALDVLVFCVLDVLIFGRRDFLLLFYCLSFSTFLFIFLSSPPIVFVHHLRSFPLLRGLFVSDRLSPIVRHQLIVSD